MRRVYRWTGGVAVETEGGSERAEAVARQILEATAGHAGRLGEPTDSSGVEGPWRDRGDAATRGERAVVLRRGT